MEKGKDGKGVCEIPQALYVSDHTASLDSKLPLAKVLAREKQ